MGVIVIITIIASMTPTLRPPVSQASTTSQVLWKHYSYPSRLFWIRDCCSRFAHGEGSGTHVRLSRISSAPRHGERSLCLFVLSQTAEFLEKDCWLGLWTCRNLFAQDLKGVFMWGSCNATSHPALRHGWEVCWGHHYRQQMEEGHVSTPRG